MNDSKTPSVFISYSWDNDTHKAWVRYLAEQLRLNGVDARLDQWYVKPGGSFTQFMEAEVASADYVLIVCTSTYAKKSNAREGGVGYEQQIVSGQLMSGIPREKFIPIIRTGEREVGDDCAIPNHFLGIYTINFCEDAEFKASLEQLLRFLFDRPEVAPPPLGIRPLLETIRETRPTPKRIIGKDGAELVLIPAGEFQMGSDDFNNTKPVHTVHINAFYMDVYPVTNAQYRKFIEATERPEPHYWNDKKLNQLNQPVVDVTWYDAMAYAEWAEKRLPTEAEWEKAARGGLEGKKYPWGDEEPDEKMANYDDNESGTTPVDKYPSNSYGLHDMAGNVYEWCLDEYQEDFYKTSPKNNPLVGGNLSECLTNYKEIDTPRVLRGGSWLDNPSPLRVALRVSYLPDGWRYYWGFRCVSPRCP